jgi:hypothetical protein
MADSSTKENELSLDVYGVSVLIQSFSRRHRDFISFLREDFSYFETSSPAKNDAAIVFELHDQAVAMAEGFAGLRVFATRMCAVFGLWGRKRRCDYGNEIQLFAENSSTSRRLILLDPRWVALGAEAYEIAFTTLLSVIGEQLDRRGFHRVHALGFERNGEAWLVVLPSGRGKSSLCAKLLNEPQIKIYSDEMPLIRDGVVYPFPIRMALKPSDAEALMPESRGRVFKRRLFQEKVLFAFARDRIAEPAPVRKLLVKRDEDSAWLKKIGVFTMAMVVGLGLAQMAEHMLRLHSISGLVGIAFSRLSEAVRVLFGVWGQNFTCHEKAWWQTFARVNQAHAFHESSKVASRFSEHQKE